VGEWASPVVLVKKKNGDFIRFAVDYRKLNALIKPQNYPLPRMQDIFDALGESKGQIFSSLDMFSGYWQLKFDPRTKEKTVFVSHEGQYLSVYKEARVLS